MRLRFLCGRDDLFVARARPAVADVRRDGAVEEGRILRDHADRRTQALLRDLRDVLAVDENAALLEIEEAQQQVDDRRFARARTVSRRARPQAAARRACRRWNAARRWTACLPAPRRHFQRWR